MSVESDARYQFGYFFEEIRKGKGLNQGVFARLAHVDRRRVDHVEKGRSGPIRKEILQMIDALAPKPEEKNLLHIYLRRFRPRKPQERSWYDQHEQFVSS